MTTVGYALHEAPLELVSDAAVQLVRQGENPELVLAAIVWPKVTADGLLEVVTETCAKGHPRTPENTYVRPNGWRYCRICVKESEQRRIDAGKKWHHKKVPCVNCGTPCTKPRPSDARKGRAGPEPRCRACFDSDRRARRAA